ncbi:MAG: hypothetical protein H8E26_14215 [FCB group bacterium]|nr:hypothetical protein [FCB group bacterium]MBL7027439.1 hypothetical protein [Candidatus Neomarinimicrobiota bacterium]
MNCPQCKNIGFKPSEEFVKPLKNIGGKESFEATNIRRYVCLQCGARFYTTETFSHYLGEGKFKPTNQEELKFQDE